MEACGWAARDTSGVLSPFKFRTRANGSSDITLKILYCGICHTDLYFIKNELGITIYPIVPGHEIIGEVIEVGDNVKKFRLGEKAGVGCMVSSCRECENCTQGSENYCSKVIGTYNSLNRADGSMTYGGYSDKLVVDEHFAVRVPDGLALDGAAPLLCAGVTVYSPLVYYGLSKPGTRLGLVGLGGLGHMAVKFAKALGLEVTVISRSPAKRIEAMDRLGADAFLVMNDQEQLQAATATMDGILNTASGAHNLTPLINLLKTNGKLILLGAFAAPAEIPVFPMLIGRKLVGGSVIGGMKETQEVMDFAAKHHITADVEVIHIDYVNTAMDRLAHGDVKYRFVIDVANSLAPHT
ncbi:probable mannitol dehydrogenase [Punica granatum]|uniref:cinnamyl-alcohol dehydrogenase n=1 Tax=Punica granatum TaxID=22663 RepID=A0A6P8EFY3_PUNGR|nr:probable mannitol dehydrogenase [Punica granatum]